MKPLHTSSTTVTCVVRVIQLDIEKLQRSLRVCDQKCNQVLGLVYVLPGRAPCIAVWVGLRICCCDDLLGDSKCSCLLWVHVPARLQTYSQNW